MRIPRLFGTLAFLSAWLVPWRPAFCIRSRQSKLPFYVHHRDLLGRHLAKYGNYEPVITGLISDFLASAPRGIVVDVGANVGWHVVHAAQHKSVATVVAFEPDSFNGWLLDRNLSLNDIENVVLATGAVGARRGAIRLYKYKRSNRGRHTVLANLGYGSRIVPMTDLDSALDDFALAGEPVLILKIDVEGYEPAVVAGARRTLARTAVVIMEFSPGLSQSSGLSVETMLDQLCAAGLAPYRLESQVSESQVSESQASTAQPLAAGEDFEGQMDLVWIRPGKEGALLCSATDRLVTTDKAKLLEISELWNLKRRRRCGDARPSIS